MSKTPITDAHCARCECAQTPCECAARLRQMEAERDQWKALFLNTMGQINNVDDRNPMCPCGAIIFEAIQRMPK